jgi:osmotically-inducible protein OsmY
LPGELIARRFLPIGGATTMVLGKQIPDSTLLKEINKKLLRTGIQAKITASVKGGYVVLTGALQYENQRRTIMRAANQVSGIRQVMDQMTVQPRKQVN